MSYLSGLEKKRLKSMSLPEFLINILGRLKDGGHSAFIVGGAVRDGFGGREIVDWDVVTSASKKEIRRLFFDTRKFTLKHDTVTLVDNRISYEVTPFRGGVGKRDLETDLGHRDFTVNAMAYDFFSESLFDPYGGRADLEKKMIRAVGTPGDRFREDRLRLLRGVRLANELNFKIEPKTLHVISLMAYQLQDVAQERIRDEFMKILLSPQPSKGFQLMRRTGLLQVILPELLEGFRKQQNRHHRFTIYRHILETMDAVEPEYIVRLTALFHDMAKPRVRKKKKGVWRFTGHEMESASLAGEIMKRLRFSHDQIKDVSLLIENHMLNYDSTWTEGAVRRLIRRVGPGLIHDLISFRQADLTAHGKHDHHSEGLQELKARVEHILLTETGGRIGSLALNGHQMMEILGIGPGPRLGRIIQRLRERVTDQPELNNETDLRRMLREEG